MKIIFFGSSEFAVESLSKLIRVKDQKLVCVVTQPDKKQGRGLKLSFTPVKDFALKHQLNIFQPQDLRSVQTLQYLRSLQPDLFIVIAYGKILPQQLLEVPKVFAVNLHASLLPKYRGAAPINWAIINGEKETGATIIKMNAALDAGEIIAQKKMAIENSDTGVSLEKKLADLGSNLLLETLEAFVSNQYKLIKQDEKKVILAPLLKKNDGLINWTLPAQNLDNLIRGFQAWPGAFTHYHDKTIKIWEAALDLKAAPSAGPGEVIALSKEGVFVKTGKDNLLIKQLQPESGKRMSAYDFFQGHKLKIGDKFL